MYKLLRRGHAAHPKVAAGLSPRLEALRVRVPAGARVADIGADHGLLSVALIETGVAERVVAVERAERPLRRLQAEVERRGAAEKVDVRWGSGLRPLAGGDVDTVIVAGMTGEGVVGVLASGGLRSLGIERLVLQPMDRWDRVRRWLGDEGWVIVDEAIVEERRWGYVVIVAVAGEPYALDDLDAWIGPRLRAEPSTSVGRFVDARIRRLDRALRGLDEEHPAAAAMIRERDLLRRELRRLVVQGER